MEAFWPSWIGCTSPMSLLRCAISVLILTTLCNCCLARFLAKTGKSKSPARKKPDLMLRCTRPKRLLLRRNERGELDDGYSHQFCRRAVYPVSQGYRAFLCAASC